MRGLPCKGTAHDEAMSSWQKPRVAIRDGISCDGDELPMVEPASPPLLIPWISQRSIFSLRLAVSLWWIHCVLLTESNSVIDAWAVVMATGDEDENSRRIEDIATSLSPCDHDFLA